MASAVIYRAHHYHLQVFNIIIVIGSIYSPDEEQASIFSLLILEY